MLSSHHSNGQGPEPPDQEQRDRIVRELDTTLLVEAAAGTGKTTSMIARMVALLCEGACTIETMAAVTFTRKAAAELRSRFQVELERTARAARGPMRQRLTDAVKQIERCFIGTIHSFCAKLLRERPVEAGVDLAFVELEPETDARLRQQAWDEHVATLFAGDDPLLAELNDLGLEINELADVFSRFVDYPDVDEWPAAKVDLPSLLPAIEALKEFAAHMKALVPTFPEDRGNDELMNKYERLSRMVQQADLEQPAELMEILELFRDAKVVQKQWPGKKAQAEAERERWTAFVEGTAQPLVRIWRERRYQVVMRVLPPAVDVYKRLKQDAGGLNYQDLLLRAAALLHGQPQIREYFRSRFTHLLVDEFQDTDPIQAEVMLLLTADDPTQDDWRRCRPVPGSLFVVGDPKQSIYRFRRADIVTYNQVKEIIQARGAVVPLSANFRTIRPLVERVNRTFDCVFPVEPDSYSPSRSPMLVGRASENDGQLAGIQILKIPEDHATTESAVACEADLIARTIRRALASGWTVPRTFKELERGAKAEANPGDFLIVARNKKHLIRYARKLEELGIPNQVTGGSSLQEIDELQLLRTCLWSLSQPDNPVALVAVLRSEMFGLSDTALYAYKRAGGRFSFRSPIPRELASEYQQSFQDAYARLLRYDSWLRRLPLIAALERILADLGLPARAGSAPGGNVRAGSLAKAIELLRAAKGLLHSTADLFDYLGQLIEKTKEFEDVPARVPETPAVRIMNLHKAKGLEAPVVFLADPTGKGAHGVELHIDRSEGWVRGYLAIYGVSTGFHKPLLAHPQNWDHFAQEEKRYQDAENGRLLYVAATRSGTLLHVTQREKKNGSNPWQFFEKHVEDCPVLEDPGPQTPAVNQPIPVAIHEASDACMAIGQRWNRARCRSYAVEAAKKTSVSPTRLGPAETEHGTEWGTVIHLLLETLMRQPDADLRELAYSTLHELDPHLVDRVDQALQTVKAVTASAIWRRALASNRKLVEVPFQILVPTSPSSIDSLPTILRGVIDLVFLEPKGWVVVDYKTDARPAAALADATEHYRGQVLLYADIWRKIVGQPVHEVGLYFTHTDRYIVV